MHLALQETYNFEISQAQRNLLQTLKFMEMRFQQTSLRLSNKNREERI